MAVQGLIWLPLQTLHGAIFVILNLCSCKICVNLFPSAVEITVLFLFRLFRVFGGLIPAISVSSGSLL